MAKKKTRRSTGPRPVSTTRKDPITLEDRTFEGTYTVESNGGGPYVCVTSQYGNKETQQGNSPAQDVASRLLFELVADFRHLGYCLPGI